MGRAKDLAAVLGLSQKQLTSLIVRRSALYLYKNEIISGKQRSLAVPINEMRRLHERIKDLLGRIVLPDYLYSPRRGRAAVDNALVHLGAPVVVKLDVKQFYPSTTAEHVFQFFHHRLGMVDDVAGRLTKLCTINGKVPFGSPLSPVLCALVHDDLFARVADRCALAGDTLTLWVDDLTVSGANISKGLVRDITRMIAAKGLKAHKAERSTARRGIVITGTHIGPDGPAPANKSHLNMEAKLRALDSETDPTARLKLTTSLIGMVNHQMSIYPNESEHYRRLRGRRQWLSNELRKMEGMIEDAAAETTPDMEAIESGHNAPWE
ncbi:reverse transcriptase family protein [Aquabacter sp. CN5-332]|uniref:reverse transcriptase family protein n=1 Tax=Aquabacter sp. CN5-332 TaxID=3156608 RepID=UPI0032B4C738